MSPRRENSNYSMSLAQHQHANTENAESQKQPPNLISNSINVDASDNGSGAETLVNDNDNLTDQLKTRCNKNAESLSAENSAVVIQKIWRGYRTRMRTRDIAEKLLKKRTHEYIDKLIKDMEETKVLLANEHKIQQLQMQAIKTLWEKVSLLDMRFVNMK